METHRLSSRWELQSLRQIHCRETGGTSDDQQTDDIKSASTTVLPPITDEAKSMYSIPPPATASTTGQHTPDSNNYRKETARISELGPRLAGYLEMNPLFLVRREDTHTNANTARPGSPEVVIIPLSPESANSPVPPQRGMACYPQRRVFLVPLFVLANFVVFVVTMYRNNCPAHETRRRCLLYTGLRRFSFQPLSQNPLLGPSSTTLLRMGALESELVTSGGQGWRLVTCIWLHAGVFHLLLNMLGLLTLGLQMESEFGPIKLGFIYLLSGFGGSLLSALFLRLTISVGASGALFGLMGALLSELLINWMCLGPDTNANWFMLSQLVVLLIINLALGKMPHVDNFAHFGGCVSGFLLGLVLLQRPHFAYDTPITGTPASAVPGIPAHDFTSMPVTTRDGNCPQQQQYYNYQHHSQPQQQGALRRCMVSMPRYKFVVWVLALNLLVVLYVVAIIMLFKGVDVRQKCKWCRQLL